jgi:hypothetical protein
VPCPFATRTRTSNGTHLANRVPHRRAAYVTRGRQRSLASESAHANASTVRFTHAGAHLISKKKTSIAADAIAEPCLTFPARQQDSLSIRCKKSTD